MSQKDYRTILQDLLSRHQQYNLTGDIDYDKTIPPIKTGGYGDVCGNMCEENDAVAKFIAASWSASQARSGPPILCASRERTRSAQTPSEQRRLY